MKLLLILFFLASCASNSNKTIIAHRGASAYLPEHTLEAVALAHGFNVDYIEPDVVLTRDNIPVVLHDIVLDEVTNVADIYPRKRRRDGHFYAIDFSLKQIKRLKVSERIKESVPKFPKRFPPKTSSFQIPTLAEYIDTVQGLNKSRMKNIGIYPEIKNPSFHRKHKKDISKIVLKLLDKKLHQSTPLILQCFDFDEVKRIRKKLGYKGQLVQLVADNSWKESPTDYDKLVTKDGLTEVRKYADGLGMWITHLLGEKGDRILKDSKELGFVIHGYTFRADQVGPAPYDSPERILKAVFEKLKLDGLFADHPDVALKFIGR